MRTKAKTPAPPELAQETIEWVGRQAKIFASKLPPCFDVEELAQVGLVGAWKALPKFDAGNGTPLHGFLFPYVLNAMRMSVRRRNWAEATAPRVQITDEAPIDNEGTLMRQQRTGLMRWLIRERLTQLQQFCLLRHLAGEGTAEIAKRGKLTRKQVCILIEDGKSQLQSDMDDIRRMGR